MMGMGQHRPAADRPRTLGAKQCDQNIQSEVVAGPHVVVVRAPRREGQALILSDIVEGELVRRVDLRRTPSS
jgi:hypothetical protein